MDTQDMNTMERIEDIRGIAYPNDLTEDIIITLNEHLNEIAKDLAAKNQRIEELEKLMIQRAAQFGNDIIDKEREIAELKKIMDCLVKEKK